MITRRVDTVVAHFARKISPSVQRSLIFGLRWVINLNASRSRRLNRMLATLIPNHAKKTRMYTLVVVKAMIAFADVCDWVLVIRLKLVALAPFTGLTPMRIEQDAGNPEFVRRFTLEFDDKVLNIRAMSPWFGATVAREAAANLVNGCRRIQEKIDERQRPILGFG